MEVSRLRVTIQQLRISQYPLEKLQADPKFYRLQPDVECIKLSAYIPFKRVHPFNV